jgi:hypothetical protein
MNKRKVIELKKHLIEKIKRNENITCEEVFILMLYLYEKMEDYENELSNIKDKKEYKSRIKIDEFLR